MSRIKTWMCLALLASVLFFSGCQNAEFEKFEWRARYNSTDRIGTSDNWTLLGEWTWRF